MNFSKNVKEKVLISKCWLGIPCRFHGKIIGSPGKIKKLSLKYQLIPVCPEQLGGLTTPRPAAPLKNKQDLTILDVTGKDVSSFFLFGARACFDIARDLNIKKAYLCKNSPSCDRTGFTGELLKNNGITVYNL